MRWGLVVLLVCGACLKVPPFQGVDGGGSGDGGGSDGDAGPTSLQQWAYIKSDAPAVADQFGTQIAISGDGATLAVGVPLDDNEAGVDAGAVYIFVTSGGTWTQQAVLKASNADAGDNFGKSVALSKDGSEVIVGAPKEDSGTGNKTDNSVTDAGAVYVFKHGGDAWAETKYLKPMTIVGGDEFGGAVAVSDAGDVVAVGAPKEDGGTSDSGAAYAFTGVDLTTMAFLKEPSPAAQDNFGTSIAVSADGKTMAVGAPNRSAAQSLSGAVYVFAFSSSWLSQQSLTAPNPINNYAFGSAVALSGDGDVLAITATGDASNATGVNGSDATAGFTRAGAAFLFERTATAWSQTTYIKASNPDSLDQFGVSIAMTRDATSLLIGATWESSHATGINGLQGSNDASQAGAAYLFTENVTWAQRAYVKASNTGGADTFGSSVALADNGTTFAVGAPFEDGGAPGVGGVQNDATMNSGAVYLFHEQ